MLFSRNLLWLIFGMIPFFIFSGCGDLEPEMQDTRSVVLKMNFNQRSSSRSSQISQDEVSSHKTHLILALPAWENLSSNYRNYYSSFARELMNPSNNKVSLEIPLNTQLKIFAFLFSEDYTMPQLFSEVREVGYYGQSQPFSIGKNTNNLSLNINLQSAGTGSDTGGSTDTLLDTTAPTASVTTATITTSDSAVVQSTETGTAYLVNTTVSVSNLASITVAADNKWNSVTISSADTYTYLTATGLVDGTYKVYVVDAAGNLSSASINSVTIVTAATSATLATPYWQLIAKQVDSDHFTDGSDELFSSNNVKNTFLENEDDNSSSTFMSIGNLNKSYYADNGTYKFKLVWDGMQVTSENIKEVIWTQTSWLDNSIIHSDIGFQEIGTSGYYTQNISNGFWGLGKSESNKCVIDGNGSSTNWWHCVGAKNKHNNGMPGPKGLLASSMHLYIWALNDGSQLGGSIQGKALSLTTKVTSLAGSGTGGTNDGTGTSASFNEPYAITTDSKNLYVADYGSHTIRKIVISTGAVTTLAGTAGTSGSTDGTGTLASLNRPYDITTDGTNLYVADYFNHTIRKIVISTGAVTTLAGTAGISGTTNGTGTSARFENPLGITTDGTNLYVVEYNSNLIRKIVISTALVTTIADTGTSSSSYNVPLGVTTDGANLYVAQMGSHKIHKIVIATGVVTTIAGGGYGSSDGTGTLASFGRPTGITTDGISLYVADKDNHKIRKIE